MNNQPRQPLVLVSFIFASGITLGLVTASHYWWISLITVAVFLLGWLLSLGSFTKNDLFQFIFFYLFIFSSGSALTHLHRHTFDAQAIHRITTMDTQEVVLKGHVVTMPLESRESSFVQCVLAVEEIYFVAPDRKETRQTSGLVWARLLQGKTNQVLYVGDKVETSGYLQAPFRAQNPGQFDQAKSLQYKNIYRTFVSYPGAIHHLDSSATAWLQQGGQKFRYYMHNALRVGLENDPLIASILAGMLYGDRTGFDEKLNEKFRRTGTLHLFAVSGQNVGILAGIGLIGLQFAGLLRWRWGWALIPCLFIYAIATGSQPSAIRAVIMASFLLIAWALDRPISLLQLMCSAAFVILLWNPLQLADVGFQLSFAVVLALILITPRIFNRLKKWGEPDPFLPRQLWPWWYEWRESLRLFLWGTVTVSLAAFLGTMPLTAYYFHLWTPVSFFVNMVVVLFAVAIVFIATLSVAVFWLSPALAVLCNNANWLVAKLLLLTVTWAAQVPGGAYYVSSLGMIWNKAPVRFTVLSVDDGQACVLQTSTRTELWDVGGKKSFAYVVSPFLKKCGINALDRVWLSQGVENHIGGVLPLWPHWKVKTFLKADLENRSSTLKKIDRLIPDSKFQKICAPFLVREKDYKWQILYPFADNESSAAQDKALVAKLVFPTCSLLLAGDIGDSVERELLKRGCDLRADILIQGRHSKEENLSETFLDQVKPKHLLFHGGGYWNFHLSSEQRKRLEDRKIKIWNLEKTGAVTITPTKTSFLMESFLYSN
ncbi:MAG: ComEC/Rec2 family competence protein [Verrucomicrobiae bacterium]|nr:ComEC/Rec2 family competence protein [Verrucomicrobiae bacterium]